MNPSHPYSILKPISSLRLPLGTVIGFLAAAGTSQAVDYYKADNLFNLNTNAAWVDAAGAVLATTPTNTTASNGDLWIWDNRVLADNSVSLGNDLRVLTLRILDPGGAVTIDGGGNRTITLNNGGGIDMSAATRDLTINNLNTGNNVGLRLSGSNVAVTINVAAGRTFTLNSKIAVASAASGATVNFTGPGTVQCNAEVQPTNLVISAGSVHLNSPAGSTRINAANLTTVNGGRLVISNGSGSATGSGAVNINNTGTLAGQGTLAGLITVNSGGILAPGTNGTGTLRMGSLNLTAGSVVEWEGTTPAEADLLDVTASNGLSLNGGTFKLYQPGTTTPFSGTGTFNLISFSGAIGGGGLASLSIDESTKIPGQSYFFGISGNFITLTIGNDTRPQGFWNVNNNGDWSNAANWTPATVPNASGFIANLGGAQGTPITAARTVTLTAPAQVGTLNFDSAFPFTLAGSSALTFDQGSAAAALGVTQGSHVISAPFMLPADGLLATLPGVDSTLTIQGLISGPGGLAKSGGTLILATDNSYAGNTSNGSGLLQIGTGGAAGSILGPIANNGSLRFHRSGSQTLAAPISGSGSVEFDGPAATTLTVDNSYSGPTTLTAGTLAIGSNLALENSTLNLSSAGGTVTLTDFTSSPVLGGLAGNGTLPLTTITDLPVSLSLGKNNASTTWSGTTTGTGDTFAKTGTGTFTLAGPMAFQGSATLGGGVLEVSAGGDFTAGSVNTTGAGSKLLVNGGNFRVAGSSLLANSSAGLEITSGTADFGAITSDGNNAAGAFFIRLTGGTLNAASLSISRGSLNIGAEPATGQTANGLYLNGGTVNVSGEVNLGTISGANSSVSARLDAGSLTVGGALTVGINNPDRWSVLDLAGGTFVSTDTLSGLRIGSGFNGRAIVHVRGNVLATAERIQFGQGDFSGSTLLNLSGGRLQVGAGGLVKGSTNPALTARLRLAGGILGATADSVSDVPVSLTGTATVTGSDAADLPHQVVFTGPVDGTGSLTKDGNGSVAFVSPDNAFTGPVSVLNGTLGLSGQTGPVDVAAAAALTPQGNLTAQGASVVGGTLAIRYDTATSLSPGRLHAVDTLTLSAGAKLEISGTGVLTAPYYILASAGNGLTGTFTLTGALPAGYTLVDNLNIGGTVPAIALVGSVTPFDTWAVSYGLSGAGAATAADADMDGLPNLVEFALGLNPVLSDGPGPIIGQSGNFLTFSFNHIAGGAITYVIEGSADPESGWTALRTYPAFAAAGTEVFTDTIPLTPGSRRFLRLRVNRNG